MSSAKSLPEKLGHVLVRFTYGDIEGLDPLYSYYTNNGQDEGLFLSQPDMAIELPDNTGTFGEGECKIDLPLDDFTDALSSGIAHSDVFMSGLEVVRPLSGGPAGSNLMRFRGKLMKATRNAGGRANSVRLSFAPVKARLSVDLGISADPQCGWTLFGRGCGLNPALGTSSCEIASVNGKQITIVTPNGITSPSSPGGNVDRFWERGYIKKDGIRVSIRQWKLTPTPEIFELRSKIPASWVLAGPASIVIVAGCHKSDSDCIDVWDNESQFMGLGIGMPDYNPLYEKKS